MKKYEQLVDSAMQLFYRQGFHATGVDLLSKEAEITKKTLYRYFPTKEALVQAALRHRDEVFLARMQARVEVLPPPERPAGYIDFILEWAREADFHGCAFINAAAEYPDHADAVHVIAAEHKQSVRHYLERLCAEAGLMSPQATGWQLFMLGEGLTVTAQVEGLDEVVAEQARVMAAALLQR